MNYKKIILIVSFLITSFFSFNFSTPKVEAQTVVEIQALIQQLQSQIQSLQQQLAQIERTTPHPVTPSLNIISPIINQRIEAGTIHTISWNVRETGSRQNIQVHQRIAGGRWTHLTNLNFNTTSYNWTVPFVNQATNVEILIGVAEGGSWIVTNIIPVQIIPTTVPVAVPIITAISPTSARINDWITIHGRNLLNTTSRNISINSLGRNVGLTSPALRSQLDGLALTFQLTPDIVNHFGFGTHEIQAINDIGISNAINFTIIAPVVATPAITSISPTSGTANDWITIHGVNLVDTIPSGVSIEFLRKGRQVGVIRDPIHVQQDGLLLRFQLTGLFVAMGETGTHQIRVINDRGTSNAVNFTIVAPITISTPPTLSPSVFNLHVNSWSASDNIAIIGTNIISTTGQGGTTNYSRSIAGGTSINLTAPETVAGGLKTFSNWSGCISSTSRTINITMPSSNTTCTANYRFGDWALTVLSENATGVWIGSDTGHSGNTNYQKMVRSGANVELRASPTAPNGRTFQRWRGCAETMNRIITLVMPHAGVTCTAVY